MTLTLADFAAICPILILVVGALLVLLLASFEKGSPPLVTICTLLLALGATFFAPMSTNILLTPWLKFDFLAKFFTQFFLVIGLGATLLATSFFQELKTPKGEYFFLLLASLFGLVLIGAAADFLTLFIGIETLSISLYILCGYMKGWTFSAESAMKYFFMGSLAAAFLLYGIALIYGATGTTNLGALQNSYTTLSGTSQTLFLSGIAFVTFALAFEIAIVPFHFWAPDVYEGAPTPVTAFMAVGTKVGAFAAFVRVFMEALPHFDPLWHQGMALLAYPTLIYANFVAMRQTEMRRFFAYSGISHAGFLLIPLAVGTEGALSALLFYLVVYAIATLGCFAVLSFLDKRSGGAGLNDLKGLLIKSPFLGGVFALCLLTLAGIPPTVGFFAKFYIFKIAFEAGYYALVVVALLTTILSAYYYLRIIAVMSEDDKQEEKASLYLPSLVVGTISFGAILVFSFYPNFLFNLIKI